jgi:hypothetical protein
VVGESGGGLIGEGPPGSPEYNGEVGLDEVGSLPCIRATREVASSYRFLIASFSSAEDIYAPLGVGLKEEPLDGTVLKSGGEFAGDG